MGKIEAENPDQRRENLIFPADKIAIYAPMIYTAPYNSKVHRWFYVQEPTREVSGLILWGMGEQVHKGT
jgi:hypothetical protein